MVFVGISLLMAFVVLPIAAQQAIYCNPRYAGMLNKLFRLCRHVAAPLSGVNGCGHY
ncbi:hypothetical protein ACNKHU_15120 [Shigella flexneri]